ncbi:MAG TPA: VWA domain-containing protein, partial [Thermoanaerobaculia bacterium]|nr:VWA domain-containing protein [Thermoanaerobaculia bacterium]
VSPASPRPGDIVAPAGPEPSAEPVPPRRVVIFVDLKTTDMFQRKRVASSISGLLDSLGPNDEVMVVSWNGTLVIEVDPTADHEKVRAGFTELARRASIGRTAKLRMEQGTSPTWRRQAVQMLTNDLKRAVVALRVLLRQMAPVSGRKVLILVSEGFQLQPGRELFIVANPSDMDVASLFDLESEQGPELIRSLADSANAAGVTLYAIHGGGLSALGSVEHVSIMPELPPPDPANPTPLRNFEAPQTSDETEMVRERILNSVEGMTELAERSGGTVTRNLNDFRAAFGDIAADISSYYSIGYRVTASESPRYHPQEDQKERRIEVRMRDARYTARARTSIPVRSPEMEIADAVVGRLAFPGGDNDLGITARAGEAERTGRRRTSVPIDVFIPLEILSFTEEGEAFAASLSVYLGAVDAGNANTEVRRFDVPVRIGKDDFAKIGGNHYTYRLLLDLRSRSVENRVAIGVLDNTSKLTGFAVLDIGDDR